MKGQKSRSGAKTPPWFEGGQMPLQRRVPKRGFTNNFRIIYQVVNLGQLQEIKPESPVTPELLLQRRLIRKKRQPVKILGRGELSIPLHIRAHAFSQSAIKKITSAGGTYEVI
jgi:large subunit ribosomal protein L15